MARAQESCSPVWYEAARKLLDDAMIGIRNKWDESRMRNAVVVDC